MWRSFEEEDEVVGLDEADEGEFAHLEDIGLIF
jgi:hypothetical protein